MPYRTNASLPKPVRDALPVSAQRIYREVFNNAWKEYAGSADREAIAHRTAWSAVKRRYEKTGGRWKRKAAT